MTVEEKLQRCLSTLEGIKDSGYIPFASPAPSSTERIIKKYILDAQDMLDNALSLHREMYGRK